MVDVRDAAAQAIQEVAAALKDAQVALRVAEVAALRGLRRNDRGVPTAALLRANPVTNYRPQLDKALARLERARHAMTVATFRIGLDEGMSIGELSRIYGFSRQRAARYAAEARAGRKVGDATRRLKRMDGPARSTAGKGSAVAAGRE